MHLIPHVVAATLVFGGGTAFAQTKDEMRGSLGEVASEFHECSVYFLVSSTCVATQDSDLAGKVRAVADRFSNEAISGLRSVGMSDDAYIARGKLLVETMMKLMRGNCTNIAVLQKKYMNFCQRLNDNPDARLTEWMMPPRVKENMRRSVMSRGAITAIVLVLSFAAPVAAGPFEDATAAHDRGDYATALRLIRPLAEGGLGDAQVALGFMYSNGSGVPQSETEALKWYRLAADQGNARAEYNLGVAYGEGKLAPQDEAEALKWYRLAADQGHARAQSNLGAMYHYGRGVPQNDGEALKWYRLAADQGNAGAQSGLGAMYADGQGDYVIAYMWFSLSAAQGYQKGIENRDRLAHHMTSIQIAEAQKRVREWKPTAPPLR